MKSNSYVPARLGYLNQGLKSCLCKFLFDKTGDITSQGNFWEQDYEPFVDDNKPSSLSSVSVIPWHYNTPHLSVDRYFITTL